MKPRESTWYVTIEHGPPVMLDDSQSPSSWMVHGPAANLFNIDQVQPFRAAYRTPHEAIAVVRDIGERSGLQALETSPYSPHIIPEPDRDGFRKEPEGGGRLVRVCKRLSNHHGKKPDRSLIRRERLRNSDCSGYRRVHA